MENIGEVIQSLISTVVPKSFVGDFASLDADGVSIKLSEGEDTTRYLGMTTTIRRPYVVIVARSSTYSTAETWLASIRTRIDTYRSGDILSILMSTPPLYLGRDDQKMHEFQVIYKVMMKE